MDKWTDDPRENAARARAAQRRADHEDSLLPLPIVAFIFVAIVSAAYVFGWSLLVTIIVTAVATLVLRMAKFAIKEKRRQERNRVNGSVTSEAW